MGKLCEDKISPIVEIDLNKLKNNKLDESFLRMFGAGVQHILGAMFDGSPFPVSVRGSKNEVQAFMKVLAAEKKYADSYRKFGLMNPSTFRNKHKLSRAVEAFEKETGLIYPIH